MGIAIEALDTHRFQDLVDVAKRQINMYCPEWTNHNVSDPGVALVELFVWMTEMTLFQLDKVPAREMAVLLNSVGFELFPAQAATADLTFYLASGSRTEVVVPAKTTVAAPLDGREIFETEIDLRIVQPAFSVCRVEQRNGVLTESPQPVDEDGATVIRFDEDLVCFDGLEDARARWRDELIARTDLLARAAWSPPDRFTGDVMYFGFEKPLSRAVVRAAFEVGAVSGLGIDPQRPPLIWESSTTRGWNRCRVHGVDTTGGLNRTGAMEIQVGAQHDPMILATGQAERYWLRLRIDLRNRETQRVYIVSPELRSVSFTTIGGTVPAVNAVRHERQVVGVSNGTPGQRIQLDGSILGGHQSIDVWVGGNRWTRRDDFAGATETSRVFVADEAAGEIVFGPLVHQAAGEPRQHGAVPRDGSTITATYCTGGGPSGNVQPGRITSLQTAIDVDSVTNLEAASGGVERENLEEALRRAPAAVRAGDRAVTAGDFERIVLNAARDLHSVTCRPPDSPGGKVQMLIVPAVQTTASEQTIDDYALSPSLCARIMEQLEPRRLVGTTIELTTPFYLAVSAIVVVRRASQQASTHGLRDSILRKLFSFVNPIEGGETGVGLGFGEVITAERIADQVRRVHGVDAVIEVALFEVDVRIGSRAAEPTQRIELPPDTLFMSYRHHVIFEETTP